LHISDWAAEREPATCTMACRAIRGGRNFGQGDEVYAPTDKCVLQEQRVTYTLPDVKHQAV